MRSGGANIVACVSAVLGLFAAHAQDTQSADDQSSARFDVQLEDVVLENAAWNERFTLGPGARPFTNAESLFDYDVDVNAGANWGFTLKLENVDEEAFDLEAIRAGAYFDFTPRLRFGGQLSFSSSSSDLDFALEDTRDNSSEIKIRSAFRF